MEKKNILPELQRRLLFVVEYKLYRDNEVTNTRMALIFPYSVLIHSIQFVNSKSWSSIICQKIIANKEEKYYLHRLYWWILSSEIWSVKYRRVKFEMVKVPWETFSKG